MDFAQKFKTQRPALPAADRPFARFGALANPGPRRRSHRKRLRSATRKPGTHTLPHRVALTRNGAAAFEQHDAAARRLAEEFSGNMDIRELDAALRVLFDLSKNLRVIAL